jgi:beta-glucanase (GH16 family)
MKTTIPLILLLSLSACKKIDLLVNPQGFTSGRCTNGSNDTPSKVSPYQKLVWADEFNGMEPGEDPTCYSRKPNCVGRLDWPGSGTLCPKETDFNLVKDLNKCNWKLWSGFSFWGEWPKGGKFSYHPNQVSVSGGQIHFTLKHRVPLTANNCGKMPGLDPSNGGYYGTDCEWVSGGVDSSTNTGSFPGRNIKNGRIEFRAKLPSGMGVYPALWTWVSPKNEGAPYKNPGQMAFSGEYDLLEATTKESGKIGAFQTYHDWGYTPTSHAFVGSGTIYLKPDTWYKFGVERYNDKIKFYIDDCFTHEVRVGDRGARINDLAQYLIMNLAMENSYATDGIAGPLDGKSLDVDYVRLYE